MGDAPALQTATKPRSPARTAGRLDSIDLMRGLVIVVMALDHVRDFCHHDSLVPKDYLATLPEAINPVNLDETNGWLFLTRWVTHYCMPTFVFLAGVGAFLHGSRCRGRADLSLFLLTRGVWLMLLDLTVIRVSWAFNVNYWATYNGEPVLAFGGGIIWVIGAAMVLMSVLVFLPTSAVAAFGVAVVAFHNLLDSKTAGDLGLPGWLWGALHVPKEEMVTKGVTFATGYGVLPCLGIMAAGFGFGALYLLEPGVRRRQLLGLGLMLSALFVALRFSNLYGDPATAKPALPGPWSVRPSWDFTFYSFLNCQKYPPSLMYTLMTLGPGITLLGLFEWARGPLVRFFVVFGRVPLFFYLLHIPLIHGLIVALDFVRYGTSPQATDGCWAVTGKHPPSDYGVSLPVVYLMWMGVILLLFPLCWWFARAKQRHRTWWLSYL